MLSFSKGGNIVKLLARYYMMLLYHIVVITRLCFCIFQNMRKQLLTVLNLGLAEAIFISENVIFHKTNEILITRAKWLATFIIELIIVSF